MTSVNTNIGASKAALAMRLAENAQVESASTCCPRVNVLMAVQTTQLELQCLQNECHLYGSKSCH